MNDPVWFLRDNAGELCDQCGTPIHDPAHDHRHRGWVEWQVALLEADLRSENDEPTPGPHLHMEPRTPSGEETS